MLDDLLIGFVLMGAAIWRVIGIQRKAPGEQHSIAENADAFFFPEDDRDHR